MNASSLLSTSNSGVLTQATGHTINGQGTISAALINQGLVDANVGGKTLSLATNAMANASTLEATGGGLLGISTTVNNAGGILLASGGTVDVNSGGAITGGTLTSTGTSYFQATNSTGISLSGVTISNGSQFNIPVTEAVTVANGITNNGTITVGSGSNGPGTALTFSGGQTLSGTGSVTLNIASLTTSSSGLLTQSAGHTISGQGTINAALINQGLINANVSGGTLSLATNPMANSGTMEASNSGTLSISTTVNNPGGQILATSGGSLRLIRAARSLGER